MPPTVANFGNTDFPLGRALEDIPRVHERLELADFELRGRTAKLLDLKCAGLLKSREVGTNGLGSDAVHWNFRVVRCNGTIEPNVTMRRCASLHASATKQGTRREPVICTQVTAVCAGSLVFQTLAGHA